MAVLKLLISFFKIGLLSIGGGYATIPLIQEEVVNSHHWLTMREFTDIITISQMTPGPLAVNTSTFVGIRIGGFGGAAAATFGCIISGSIIAILLYRFFAKHKGNDLADRVLRGLKAASTGLIASAAGTILILVLKEKTSLVLGGVRLTYLSAVLFAAALFVLRKWKVNPMAVIFAAGAVGAFIF